MSTLLGAMMLCLGELPACSQQEADPFVGRFRHPEFEIELRPALSGYYGYLTVKGIQYEVFAHKKGDDLEGYFMVEGYRLTFTARAEKDGLVLLMPLARSVNDVRRSFGQIQKLRYRAKRIEQGSWSSQYHHRPDQGQSESIGEHQLALAPIPRSRE